MQILPFILAVASLVISNFTLKVVAAPIHTPILPPSYPLAVRNPYLSGSQRALVTSPNSDCADIFSVAAW